MIKVLLVAVLVLASGAGAAGSRPARGAATNVPDALTRASGLRLTPMPHAAQLYAVNCQGCHGEKGVSVAEIPALAGRVGYFTRIARGRGYLVQVPNVALNPNSDAVIAELLNWVLMTYSREQLPADFRPYTAEEVAIARRQRIDVAATRRALVERLIAENQVPSAQSLAVAKALND